MKKNLHQAETSPGMTVAACLWFGAFPLLQRGSYSGLTLDKWHFMLGLSCVTLLCFLADAFRRRLRRPSLPALLAVLALLGWMVFSCWRSPESRDVWWLGASVRREGLATQLCYGGLFLLFLCSRPNQTALKCAAAAGVALFGTVVLLQRAGGNPLGLYPAGRSFAANPEFQGTIGNIDIGTGYLCLLCGWFAPALCREISTLRKKEGKAHRRSVALTWVYGAALILCVYLIFTMEVQFGALALLALAVYLLLCRVPRRFRLSLLLLLLVCALLVVWFWPGQSGGLWELREVLHGRPQLSFGSNRLGVWVYSLRMARESLLTGGGSDTFELRFNAYLQAHDLHIPTAQGDTPLPSYFDTPHNEYLAQLCNHGLPALCLFLLLMMMAVLPPLIRKRDRKGSFPSPARAAVLIYAAQACFSFSICILAPLFWVTLALAFAEI